MNKTGILFTSRNNYNLLETWLSKIDTEGFDILNIDEDSSDENKNLGREVCEKYGAVYMDREERGLQNNMSTAVKHFGELNINWAIWFQHDCFPIDKNFFSTFNELVLTGQLDEFGTVGFNQYHTLSNPSFRDWVKQGYRELQDTARAPLEPGDKYYRNKRFRPDSRVDYSKGFDKPFAVESVCWYSVALNLPLFKEHVIPTGDYHFFHAWDDICFQFLYKNVYNVTVPYFNMLHDQLSKEESDMPVNSPRLFSESKGGGDSKEGNFYYGKWGHLEVWKERWGFDYEDRNTFEPVKEQYKDTLLWHFYHHDPISGPLRSFDFD